jgi:hypothetical protein
MEIIGKTIRQNLGGNEPFNGELFEVISYNADNRTCKVDLLDEKHRKTGNIGEFSVDTVEIIDVVELDLLLEK